MAKNEFEFLLSVRLMIYNNEAYIEKALNSILTQKTTFPIEVVIGDDFSTDRTFEVVNKFKSLENISIKILNRPQGGEYWKKRQNANWMINYMDIVDNCKGKYIALLDGDDYWTDPYKIQKQVDFLEANQDYVLACHRYNFVDENNEYVKPDPFQDLFEESDFYEFDSNKYLKRFVTQSCTMVFEKKYFNNDWKNKYEFFRDKSIYFELLKTSNKKGVLLNDISAVYRVQNSGVYMSLKGLDRTKTQYKVNFEIFLKNIIELKNHSFKDSLRDQNHWLLYQCKKENDKKLVKSLLKDAFYLNSFLDYFKIVRIFFRWTFL